MAKKILNEATVRRFMKLASIDKLSESYFDETKDEEVNEDEKDDVEESVEETDKTKPIDEEVSLPGEEEEEMGGEMDMGAEEVPAEEEPVGDTAAVADALQTIADALSAAGIDVSVEDSGEEEMPMDDEIPAEEEPEMAEAELSTAPVLDEDYYQSVKEQVIARLKEEFAAKIHNKEDGIHEDKEDVKEESKDEE
jgi:hypothetical protein